MRYSAVFLVLLVLAGFSFAVSLQCNREITSCVGLGCTMSSNQAAAAGGNCINISASNIVVNCSGYNITGNGAVTGFYINNTGLSNITIENCGVYNFSYGIDGYTVNTVDGLTVQDSVFYNSSTYGVVVAGENNTVTGSTFERNFQGLALEGDYAEASGNTFTNNAYGLLLSEGNHSSATYNVFNSDNTTCISVDTQDNLEVQRNNLTSCGLYGVDGYDLLNTEFSNNTILNPWMGGFFINITAYAANVNVDLLNNTVNWSFNYTATYPDAAGIVLYNGTGGEIRGNILANNNGTGLSLNGLYNTEITGNQVLDNQYSTGSHGYGVVMLYSDEILFENNIVAGNGYDASTTGFGGMLLAFVTNSQFSSNNISDNAERNGGSGLPFGVAALDLENVTFSSNAISNNNGTGLFLSVSGTTANEGIEVTDSLFSSQADGVTITDSPDLVLTGNAVENNLGYGAFVWRCNGSLVQDNAFEWNENNTAAALYILDSYYGTVDTNDFTGNGNGLYLDTTNATNVTENGFVANGVGLLDALSDDLLIDSNTFNESTNLTAVALSSVSAVFSNNRVYGNVASGLVAADSGQVDVTDNNFYDHISAYAAVEVYNSSDVDATGNTLRNNSLAMVVTIGDNFTASENTFTNNSMGLWIMESADTIIDANTFTNNQAWQLFLYNTTLATVTDNVLTADTLVSIGIFTELLTDSEFSGNTMGGPHIIGYAIADESADNTVTSDIVYGALVGFLMDNSTGTTLAGTESYSNVLGYQFDDYANATIINATSHDNTGTCLALAPGNATLENFRLWSCAAYIDSDENSSINATDLWIGYDNTYGIHYGSIMIDETAYADITNVLLDRVFVSMNSSDTDVSELNVSANVTISVDGCSNLRHYNASGFPQTRAEVLAGNEFTPAYSACGSRATTFEVPGFSGYAAAGVTLTSSGTGGSSFTMSVSGDRVAREELTITILDGTTPVSGAVVKAFYWEGGILQVQGLGSTNSQGKVTFTPAFAASYKITADKAGYSEGELRFIVSAATTPACTSDVNCAVGMVCTAGVCVSETQEAPTEETPAEPETPGTTPAQQECASNADCAYNEACSGGSCVIVPAGACGEYTNHAWVGYNCCANADCGVGYACTNHNCVQSGPTETEVPGTGGAASLPGSAPNATGNAGTPWLLVVVAVLIGAAVVWWLFVRKP